MSHIEAKYWQIHSWFDNSQTNVDLMNTEYDIYICLIIGDQKSNIVEYYW